MAAVMTSCKECDGTGMVTSMEPQPLKGCKLRSSHRVAAQNRKCSHCSWGRVRVEVEDKTISVIDSESQPIMFAGIEIDAPGFVSQEQFEQALLRALVDELQVKPHEQSDRYVVGHPNSHAYLTSRDRCSCKAGVSGQPCKHRAALILELDIRQPAVERQWAKLRADRRSARVVA